MFRKATFTTSCLLVLSLLNAASGGLVGHWSFDDGTPMDISGNGMDGVLLGDAAIATDPDRGEVLQVNQSGIQVDGPFAITNSFTLTAWVKLDLPRTGRYYFGGPWWFRTDNEGDPEHYWIEVRYPEGNFLNKIDTRTADNSLGQLDGEWHHLVLILPEDGAFTGYFDGAIAPFRDADPVRTHDFGGSVGPLFFGTQDESGGNAISGYMDDIRVFNHAISEDEVQAIMSGAGLGVEFPHARRPEPEDGAILEATWAILSWRAGDYAVSHDVYLSDNFDDVNTGAEAAFRGNKPLADTTLTVGFPGFPLPEGLVPGTTYYWRVDEVNDSEPNSPWTGPVWSLSVPPKTAYSPVPADGAKFIELEPTLSWTAGFGAKLNTVYFGDDFDTVADATGGKLVNETTFDPGALEKDKTYYWRVDQFEGPLTHKGDVWSFTTLPDIPVHSNPDLVALWTFEEGQGSTALDWSGHDNHATLFGSEWTTAALGDTGLSIGDYGAIQNLSYAADDLTEVTVTAWVRTNRSSDQYIVSFDRNEYYRLEINGSGAGPGQIGWDVMTSSGQVDYGSLSRVDDGRWHHVAGVYDKGLLTIYIDGIAEPSAGGGPTYGSGNTRYGFIGANSEATDFNGNRGGGSPVSGEVDDIRIYHKALTEEEIVAVMRGDPKLAGDPIPARDAIVDIRDISSLSWSPGDAAASHDVYFGTDRGAMQFKGNQAGTSFSLADLVEFGGGDYFWRIDEVATDGTVAEGTVWKFTVPGYLVVDDFKSYNDLNEDEPGSNRVYLTWIDGFGSATNGSQAGNLDPPFMSDGRSGAQAMPVSYDNAGKTSEVTRTLTSTKDWTEYGVTKLVVWFNGDSANAPERMFVALGDSVVYHDDPSVTQVGTWTEWVIDLTDFTGVDLANVSSITIGFGTRNAPSPTGGTGTVLIDDIRLNQ